MPAYLCLALAIASEVVGTLALRSSRGFTAWMPAVLVVVSYAVAFYMLSLALRSIDVGTAYAIWSGIGTAMVAVAAAILFGERLTATAIGGIVLIILGVVVLESGVRNSSSTGSPESSAAGQASAGSSP